MKNAINYLSIMVFLALITFSTCESSVDNNTPSDPPLVTITTNSINVNGSQLYDDNTGSIIATGSSGNNKSYPNYFDFSWTTVNLSNVFTSPICNVSSGKFTLNLSTPNSGSLKVLQGNSGYNMGTTVSGANATTVKGLILMKFQDNPVQYGIGLYNKNERKSCYFIYVDQAITLNGPAGQTGYSFSNVSLSVGWNTILVDVNTGQMVNGTPDSNFSWTLFSN